MMGARTGGLLSIKFGTFSLLLSWLFIAIGLIVWCEAFSAEALAAAYKL